MGGVLRFGREGVRLCRPAGFSGDGRKPEVGGAGLDAARVDLLRCTQELVLVGVGAEQAFEFLGVRAELDEPSACSVEPTGVFGLDLFEKESRMKQNLTIEVDVPDGYEAIDWRPPDVANEWWLTLKGGVVEPGEYKPNAVTVLHRIILRPIWTAPEWLKPGWIAMNLNGEWWWAEKEPHQRSNNYWSCDAEQCKLSCLNWTPPPCSDWKESKREIKALPT